MRRIVHSLKMMAIASAGGMLWVLGSGSCLVDDFWITKSSEIVNRFIFGAINAALGQAGPI